MNKRNEKKRMLMYYKCAINELWICVLKIKMLLFSICFDVTTCFFSLSTHKFLLSMSIQLLLEGTGASRCEALSMSMLIPILGKLR